MPERTILAWLLIGLVTGVVARALLPGRAPGGTIMTVLVGVAGALLAGFLVHGMGIMWVGTWVDHAAAALGAVALLAACRLILVRRIR